MAPWISRLPIPVLPGVSADPRNPAINPYPSDVGARIEAAWQRKDEKIELPDFHSSNVWLHYKDHRPFQRTAAGKRDVRRVCLPDGPSCKASLAIAGFPGRYQAADGEKLDSAVEENARQTIVFQADTKCAFPLGGGATESATYPERAMTNPLTGEPKSGLIEKERVVNAMDYTQIAKKAMAKKAAHSPT